MKKSTRKDRRRHAVRAANEKKRKARKAKKDKAG